MGFYERRYEDDVFCFQKLVGCGSRVSVPMAPVVVFVKRAELDHMARGKKKDAEAGCI